MEPIRLRNDFFFLLRYLTHFVCMLLVRLILQWTKFWLLLPDAKILRLFELKTWNCTARTIAVDVEWPYAHRYLCVCVVLMRMYMDGCTIEIGCSLESQTRDYIWHLAVFRFSSVDRQYLARGNIRLASFARVADNCKIKQPETIL